MKNRRLKWLIMSLLTFLPFVAVTVASAEVITGELVDTACYTEHGGKGESHRECAIKCAKSGIPLGVLDESSGKVFTLATETPKIADHAGRRARVTGKVSGNLIVPQKLEVESAGQFSEVQLGSHMM